MHTVVVELQVDEAQVCKSVEAMKSLYSVLGSFYFARRQVFREGPRNARSPQDVQTVLAGIFLEFMPVMAVCFCSQMEDVVNACVDSLIGRTLAYKALWDIICTTRDKIDQHLSCSLHKSIQNTLILIEEHNQIVAIRCTCKRLSTVDLGM